VRFHAVAEYRERQQSKKRFRCRSFLLQRKQCKQTGARGAGQQETHKKKKKRPVRRKNKDAGNEKCGIEEQERRKREDIVSEVHIQKERGKETSTNLPPDRRQAARLLNKQVGGGRKKGVIQTKGVRRKSLAMGRKKMESDGTQETCKTAEDMNWDITQGLTY